MDAHEALERTEKLLLGAHVSVRRESATDGDGTWLVVDRHGESIQVLPLEISEEFVAIMLTAPCIEGAVESLGLTRFTLDAHNAERQFCSLVNDGGRILARQSLVANDLDFEELVCALDEVSHWCPIVRREVADQFIAFDAVPRQFLDRRSGEIAMFREVTLDDLMAQLRRAFTAATRGDPRDFHREILEVACTIGMSGLLDAETKKDSTDAFSAQYLMSTNGLGATAWRSLSWNVELALDGRTDLVMFDFNAERTAGRWLPDPFGRFAERYWSGTRWTTQVKRKGVFSTKEAVDDLALTIEEQVLGPGARDIMASG